MSVYLHKAPKMVLLGLALMLMFSRAVLADEQDVRDLRERMEKLERQNEMLLRRLESAPIAPVVTGDHTQPVSTEEEQQKGGDAKLPADKPPADKPPADKSPWIDVGKNLNMKVAWDNYYPWLMTDDGAFRIHVGGRTQFDMIWAKTTQPVQFGVGGIGKFQDAFNFRRGRLEVEGWMYEVFDFMCEYDFFNTQNVDPTMASNPETNVTNIPVPTEMWGAVNHLPFFGTIRAGNMKPAISLEHITSSRYLDFLERSSVFDAYYNRNNGFQPGIQMFNWTENERLTWALGFFKNNNTVQGWNVSDGDYQLNTRITALPFYRDEGRYMVHLGFGMQYAAPDNGREILRQRWLLRNGPAATQNTVAFASVLGENEMILEPELFINIGPLSIQAEYLTNFLDSITGFTTQSQGTVATPQPGAERTYFSHGGYLQAMYFLTGEHRPYGRTALHGSGAATSRIVPFRNFFWLPGQGCPNPFSTGAWQVGARWSYSDLSNHGINGGQTNECTLGLNWFLNPNAKIQWNYDIGYRGQLGVGSSSNGTYQGFGTRLAFDF